MTWDWQSASRGASQSASGHDAPDEKRVGDLVSLINGLPYDSKYFGDTGEPLVRIRSLLNSSEQTRYDGPELTTFRVTKETLLVGMDGDFNVSRWRRDEDALLNQRVLALSGQEDILKWIEYCLPSALTIINDLTYATTVKHLSSGQVSRIRIPWPGRAKVREIVDYLDHETAEIDALVDDLARLDAKLEERLFSEIASRIHYHDTSPASQDGHIPTKRVASITLGKMLDASSPRPGDLSLEYLRAANVQPLGVLDLSDLKSMRFSRAESSLLTLQKGDVAVVEGGQGGFGRAAYIPEDLKGVGFQNSIIRIRPCEGIDGRYIAYSFILLRQMGYMDASASLSSMPHYTAEKVAVTPIPHMDMGTQHIVSDELDDVWQDIQNLRTESLRAITLAKERRAALITAAVTGKIDITAKNRPAAEQLEDDIKELS